MSRKKSLPWVMLQLNSTEHLKGKTVTLSKKKISSSRESMNSYRSKLKQATMPIK
jgi:hypothetical protein